MSNCPLCNLESSPGADARKIPAGLMLRGWRRIQWAFPVVIMVLIPKCPMCIAADVALLSGIGISVTTARWIRVAMLALCVSSIVYLVIRRYRNRVAG